ncbi:MAG: hypothetical protein HC794_09145 [Nitrospiraceae bacterium]|nr:hypothetical protein [Nitrospiraceae bacterium]
MIVAAGFFCNRASRKARRRRPGFEKDEAYRSAQGTIYKFPPTGGEVKAVNAM